MTCLPTSHALALIIGRVKRERTFEGWFFLPRKGLELKIELYQYSCSNVFL